jgi:zinc and cadmium transporter
MLSSTLETVAETFAISLLSLVGVFTLNTSEVKLHKVLSILIAYSAGTILGAAFFELLPEAVEIVNSALVFPIVATDFLVFMFLERIIYWYHDHSHEFEDKKMKRPTKAFVYLNIVGDFIHNFIDGVIIAAGFLNSFSVCLATTIALAFHELPQ